MDWSIVIKQTWDFILIPETYQLGIAALIGLMLGVERELRHKDASIRTFALISTGSCLFTILSIKAITGLTYDITRIAAQIVTGIGFIGGGVIFKSSNKDKVEGITTAAMIWFSAAVGMCCGFNRIKIVIASTIIYILILIIGRIIHKIMKFILNQN